MKDVELKMLERAKQLLESGEVARVIGWKRAIFVLTRLPLLLKRWKSLTISFTIGFAVQICRNISFRQARKKAKRQYF